MNYPPYQHRYALRFQPPGSPFPDYLSSTNGTARLSRWWPLYQLLGERFRGGKPFSDYEIGALIGLREEYEGGVGRKG